MGKITHQELDERRVALLAEVRSRMERAEFGARSVERRGRSGFLARGRMRTLLLPAFVIVLLVLFGGRSGAPLGVQAAFTPGSGSSFAGPRMFDPDAGPVPDAPVRLEPGDVVGATTGSGCVLSLGRGALHLDAGARAAVASLLPPRVRLIGGSGRVSGRLRVVTANGILDVDSGDVLVQLGDEGLSTTLVEGAARVTGPDGVHDLVPGQPTVTR